MIICLLLFALLIIILGYGVLLFLPVSSRQPALALSFALGGGLITFQLFVARFYLHLNLGYWSLYLIIAEAIALFVWHFYRRSLVWPAFWSRPNNLLDSILTGALFLAGGLSLLRVFARPLIDYDALGVWSRRVQILYYHQSDLFNSASSVFWSMLAKPNYPWHLSLLAWLQTQVTGQFSISLINFLPWCYYLGLISTVYALVKEKLSRSWSLFLALLIATMPLVFQHSYSFYADLPLAFYLGASLLVWRRWLVNLNKADLCLAAALAGFALTVKSEAIFFVGPFVALTLLWLWKQSLLKAQARSLALLGPGLLWLIWLALQHLGVSNVAAGLGWHPEVLSKIRDAFFVAQSWQLWWYLVLVMLVLTWRNLIKSKSFIFSALWFILSFGCFLILYCFTETYLYALDDTAFSRNLLLFLPLSASLLSDALSSWFNKS